MVDYSMNQFSLLINDIIRKHIFQVDQKSAFEFIQIMYELIMSINKNMAKDIIISKYLKNLQDNLIKLFSFSYSYFEQHEQAAELLKEFNNSVKDHAMGNNNSSIKDQLLNSILELCGNIWNISGNQSKKRPRQDQQTVDNPTKTITTEVNSYNENLSQDNIGNSSADDNSNNEQLDEYDKTINITLNDIHSLIEEKNDEYENLFGEV